MKNILFVLLIQLFYLLTIYIIGVVITLDLNCFNWQAFEKTPKGLVLRISLFIPFVALSIFAIDAALSD